MKNSTKKELQDQLVIKSEVVKKQLKQIEELQSLIKTLTDEKKHLTDEVNMRKTNAVTREEHDEIVATKDTIILNLNRDVTSLYDTLTGTNNALTDAKDMLVTKSVELDNLQYDKLQLEKELCKLKVTLTDTNNKLVNKSAEIKKLEYDNLQLEAEVTRLTTVNRVILFVTAMTAVIAVVVGCLVD